MKRELAWVSSVMKSRGVQGVGGVVVGLACVMGGCASDGPEPDRILVAGPVTAAPGAGDAAPTASSPASAGVLRAREVTIDIPSRTDYDSGSSSTNARLRVERSLPPGGDGAWGIVRQTVIDGADAPGERSELSVKVEADGDVVLLRTLESADKVITTFSPGMLIAPREMSPGQTRVESFEMVVHPADKPGEVQARGDATVTLEHLGVERLTTPAGEIEAMKIRSVLKVKLGQAEVENTTTSWFAPGKGVVAERRRERVVVMGVPIRGGGESWVISGR